MLSLQMKLTPAQVKALMLLVYGKRGTPHVYTDGYETPGTPLELMSMSSYITTMSALQRRGLVEHKDGRYHRATPEGEAVARLIYLHAKGITDMVEDAQPDAVATSDQPGGYKEVKQ